MFWSQVCLESVAHELPEERVSTDALESQLAPLYDELHLPMGQVERLTGIRERRMWPPNPRLADCAARTGRRALDSAGVSASDIGAVFYCGVCRDDLEPATACAVADALDVRGDALICDCANACLGVLNGMVSVANMIELGQIRAGLVVAAESCREIINTNIDRMLRDRDLETWRVCLPTLTGGSGAIAVVLTHADFSDTGRKLLGGVSRAAPEHHRIARWGSARGYLGESAWSMETDAAAVLRHGVDLGLGTWTPFLEAMRWERKDIDKYVCHQVGAGHRRAIVSTLELDEEREYTTFPRLGNIGTVSLPLTMAMADEDGFIQPGDRVGLLGIGTGLNCIMLGVEW